MRTLQSELINKGYVKPKKQRTHKRNRNRKRKKQPQPTKPKTKTENMNKHDWEEIMGIRRPRYRRNRGAFRQL